MGVLGFGGTKVYKLANRAPLEYLLELRQKYGLFAFYLPTICYQITVTYIAVQSLTETWKTYKLL